MSGNKRKIDAATSRQFSLFDTVVETAAIFHPKEPAPGSLNIGPSIKELLSQALKNVPYKRYEIAGRMGEYIGTELTPYMLDAWTAESKEAYRFPAEYVPAFCWATGSYDIVDMLARSCGCYLIRSEEAVLLELAKINDKKKELAARERQMHGYLQQMRREPGIMR